MFHHHATLAPEWRASWITACTALCPQQVPFPRYCADSKRSASLGPNGTSVCESVLHPTPSPSVPNEAANEGTSPTRRCGDVSGVSSPVSLFPSPFPAWRPTPTLVLPSRDPLRPRPAGPHKIAPWRTERALAAPRLPGNRTRVGPHLHAAPPVVGARPSFPHPDARASKTNLPKAGFFSRHHARSVAKTTCAAKKRGGKKE